MTATATVSRLETVPAALQLAADRLRQCVGTMPDPLVDTVLGQMLGNVQLCRGHVAAMQIVAGSYARQEGEAA